MRRYLVLVPGLLGWLLVTFVAEMATIWSSIEMFHEGWWGQVPHRFLYLIPGFIVVLLSAIPVRWPRVGGWFLGTVGISLAFFWRKFVDSQLGLELAVPFVLGAVFFIFEGLRQDRIERGVWLAFPLPGWYPGHSFFKRPRLTLTLALPALTFIGVIAVWSVWLSARVDDGDRSMQRITGKAVDLMWAPAGPGWAHGWLQGDEKIADVEAGGPGFYNPSWNQLALYGLEPVGLKDELKSRAATNEDLDEFCLCRYLSEDGTRLMDEPVDVWRLPTVQEIASSLPHHDLLADCVWDGETEGPMECEHRPDKESPLWDARRSPIYLLSASVADSARVWFVSYSGRVQKTMKNQGNPRHGFRCVREP